MNYYLITLENFAGKVNQCLTRKSPPPTRAKGRCIFWPNCGILSGNMYKESGANIPPLTHHLLLGHEFCAMQESKAFPEVDHRCEDYYDIVG